MTWEVMELARGRAQACRMTTASTQPPAPATPDHRARAVTDRLAKPVLLADAAVTGLNGVAYLALPGVLGDAFGIPSTLLTVLGVLLIVVAAAVTVLGTRRPIPRSGMLAIAVVNGVWALGSIGYAVAGSLTGLGLTWVLVQATVVAVFAGLQLRCAARA